MIQVKLGLMVGEAGKILESVDLPLTPLLVHFLGFWLKGVNVNNTEDLSNVYRFKKVMQTIKNTSLAI